MKAVTVSFFVVGGLVVSWRLCSMLQLSREYLQLCNTALYKTLVPYPIYKAVTQRTRNRICHHNVCLDFTRPEHILTKYRCGYFVQAHIKHTEYLALLKERGLVTLVVFVLWVDFKRSTPVCPAKQIWSPLPTGVHTSWGWFDIKMPSCLERKSHYVVEKRRSYHRLISTMGLLESLFWCPIILSRSL